MRARSLSRRILAIVLSAQLVCAILLSGFALVHERHTRLRAFDESLKGRSDSVLGAIQDAEDKDNNVALDGRELRLPRGDAYRVYAADGTDLGGADLGGTDLGGTDLGRANLGGAVVSGTDAGPLNLRPQPAAGFRSERSGGETYRVYQRSGLRVIDRAETEGRGRERPVVIVYAAGTRHLQHEILEAAGVYTSIILMVMVATAVLLAVLVRGALQPLTDFAAAAGQVSVPLLRFDAPASVMGIRELRPLAEVLDDVTARLREAFMKERRFLGDAAHELKTAVAIVRSTTQVLLLKPRTAGEYTSGLERVVEDVNRVESLVAQMLSSAGAEEENGPALLPVRLAGVAAEVIASLQTIATAHEVALKLSCREERPVRLTEGKAMTLLSNLLLNAMQHSAPGMQVEVLIQGTEQATFLEVIDTGSGISEAALPHVFERFFREDRSRTRATGGTGLGLAICKSIVESAGGTIAIASSAGLGTRVTVTFMLA